MMRRMTGSRGRLLVLDDDEAVAATIALVAETSGFEVATATAFEAFWSALDAFAPTHVTLDLTMPEVDGIEVLQRLAARGFDGAVIVCSGLDRRVLEAAQRSAMEHGLDGVGLLPKPFLPADLRALLDAPVERRARARRGAAVVGEAELRSALAERRLEVAYQPKVACASGEVVGFEALARWTEPGVGPVPPDVFVPMAERLGLVDVLTEQVLDEALRWFARAEAATSTHLAVNLSARSLDDVACADRIERACAAHGVPPERVVLELTETASAYDPILAHDVLTRFRIKGLALSLDDFGTGHSTLVQLARRPFTELKIDRQFVGEAVRSKEARVIVRAMVGLAHGLGLVATAEGVEDAETLAFLAETGCDRAQGYYLGRPMAPDALPAWGAAWAHRRADRASGSGP
jgi:EAL domain-containing protein (putative c-di-GMP-specific phosphodiesterase class I)/ActR/RegA family two-component response regulator